VKSLNGTFQGLVCVHSTEDIGNIHKVSGIREGNKAREPALISIVGCWRGGGGIIYIADAIKVIPTAEHGLLTFVP
jgi:hypothetical protein